MVTTTAEVTTQVSGNETPTLNVILVAATCPSCEGHNVDDSTGLGHCADCHLTDNLSAFMGGGMTARAKFEPSKFGKSGGKARSFDAPRGWTIRGNID